MSFPIIHLECIHKKALVNAPKDLQGMMMRLQKYDVDLMYVPGKNLHLADILSRAYRPTTEGLHKDFEHVHVVGHVPISESRLEAIRTATEADQVMTALNQTILQGWPEERSHLPPLVHPYFAMRDELAVYDMESFFSGRTRCYTKRANPFVTPRNRWMPTQSKRMPILAEHDLRHHRLHISLRCMPNV